MTSAQKTPEWLIIDTRTAQEGVQSGVGRFVVGLSGALAQRLARTLQAKILLVGKKEPAAWIVELVQLYPGTVSYWSGGPGSLGRKWEKPVYFWSTIVSRRISRFCTGSFIWLAPANFDRPMFSFFFAGKLRPQRIVQVIHDTIPMSQPSSTGLLFRLQFRFLVKRTLSKLSHVFTVSNHSAFALQTLYQKRVLPISVLNSGIQEVFGREVRPISKVQQLQWRLAFLRQLFKSDEKIEVEEYLTQMASMHWVVGVGRGQKYKNWEFAETVVTKCASELKQGILFVRIGFEPFELLRFSKAESKILGDGIFFPKNSLLALSCISDDVLSKWYLLSDALLHPSLAEGFGFPPLEAAVSGLPVLFRQGTAIDEHFSKDVLPDHFWCSLSSDTQVDWVLSLAKILRFDRFNSDFSNTIRQFSCPRLFAEKMAGERLFNWHDAADRLIGQIFPSNTEKKM